MGDLVLKSDAFRRSFDGVNLFVNTRAFSSSDWSLNVIQNIKDYLTRS